MWKTIETAILSQAGSGEDLANDLAVYVGQPEVAAGVAVDQPGVVDAHQVQDRRVVVVDVHGVGDDVDAELVGLRRRRSPPCTPAPASRAVNALA